MESRITWPEPLPALKASQCSVEDCPEAVTVELETQPLCFEHFLSVSLREMDSRGACLDVKPVDTAAALALKNFVTACAHQAKALAEDDQFAAGTVKTRLAEITRRCSQLGRKLRRSPRVVRIGSGMAPPGRRAKHLGRRDLDFHLEPPWRRFRLPPLRRGQRTRRGLP